ncbi:cell envelope integrity protein CreD [Shewanella corallii]|uniref:Cell envelope integrity protein CreD n=1 Tax=Shewanella corallii TaxID=560080 RepID=A0ABT0N7T0_9GAMM|nr:cell envelope integrity protein CreD [Shewanella corallii]MCL2914496.1 cell envelope integrity protein CreD [Shewanella corallii]
MGDIIFGLLALVLLAGLGFGAFVLVKMGLKRMYGQSDDPVHEARSSLILKSTLAVMLCLLAIVPLTMVRDMTTEREGLYKNVVYEMGHTWGSKQQLAGPVLVLPYQYVVITKGTNRDGEPRETRTLMRDELLILPKQLNIDAKLTHDFRDRGIYRSLVYRSNITGQAKFDFELPQLPNLEAFDFESARLVFGLSANKSIDTVESFDVSGEGLEPQDSLQSGTGLATPALSRGFHRPLAGMTGAAPFTLDFKMQLRGSQGISFLPLGESSVFELTTDWPHPSFNGILPTARNIDEQGFSASWDITHLSRNYPQIFRDSSGKNLDEANAGTQLFEPATHYGKIDRAMKYGLLFVALTFIVLLMFELGQGQRLSPLQYMMVGAAMTLFYLLLLALSEHLSFAIAYMAAASVPVLSIPSYVASATGSRNKGVVMLAMLLGLYALLFSILRLEDYALLMGSGLLVAVLLTLMYLTRRQSAAG